MIAAGAHALPAFSVPKCESIVIICDKQHRASSSDNDARGGSSDVESTCMFVDADWAATQQHDNNQQPRASTSVQRSAALDTPEGSQPHTPAHHAQQHAEPPAATMPQHLQVSIVSEQPGCTLGAGQLLQARVSSGASDSSEQLAGEAPVLALRPLAEEAPALMASGSSWLSCFVWPSYQFVLDTHVPMEQQLPAATPSTSGPGSSSWQADEQAEQGTCEPGREASPSAVSGDGRKRARGSQDPSEDEEAAEAATQEAATGLDGLLALADAADHGRSRKQRRGSSASPRGARRKAVWEQQQQAHGVEEVKEEEEEEDIGAGSAAAAVAQAMTVAAQVSPEETASVVVVKALTRSDASTRRIILPRISIEANLPQAVGASNFPIQAMDHDGRLWDFLLRAWSNGHNPKPVYVLEHIADFMREHGVREGDVMGICRDSRPGKYVVEVNTPRVRAALIQPGHAAISLQRAQHAARMRHQQNRKLRERMQEQQVQVISHMQRLTYEMERQQKSAANSGAGARGEPGAGAAPGDGDMALCKRTPGCSKPAGHMGWCAGHRGFYNRRSAPPPPPSVAIKAGLARQQRQQQPNALPEYSMAVDDPSLTEEERATRLLQQHASLMQQQAALLGQTSGSVPPHMLPLPQGPPPAGVPPHMMPLQLGPAMHPQLQPQVQQQMQPQLMAPGTLQMLMSQGGSLGAGMLQPGMALAPGQQGMGAHMAGLQLQGQQPHMMQRVMNVARRQ